MALRSGLDPDERCEQSSQPDEADSHLAWGSDRLAFAKAWMAEEQRRIAEAELLAEQALKAMQEWDRSHAEASSKTGREK